MDVIPLGLRRVVGGSVETGAIGSALSMNHYEAVRLNSDTPRGFQSARARGQVLPLSTIHNKLTVVYGSISNSSAVPLRHGRRNDIPTRNTEPQVLLESHAPS